MKEISGENVLGGNIRGNVRGDIRGRNVRESDTLVSNDGKRILWYTSKTAERLKFISITFSPVTNSLNAKQKAFRLIFQCKLVPERVFRLNSNYRNTAPDRFGSF